MAITGYIVLTDKYIQEFIVDVLVVLVHFTASMEIFMTFLLEPLDSIMMRCIKLLICHPVLWDGCIKHVSSNAEMITQEFS